MILLGVFLGGLFGLILATLFTAGKVEDLERENQRLNYENTTLRERLKRVVSDAIKENGG